MTTTARDSTYAFDHVAQQVPDVHAAVDWYTRNIPGARVLYEDDSWAFVEACGTKLAFIQQGHHPDHIGFRVSDDLLQVLAARHGQPIRPHRDGTRSFYLAAPGDRWVEFISYPPESHYDARHA